MLPKEARGNLQRRQPVLQFAPLASTAVTTGCNGAFLVPEQQLLERIFCELF